MNLVVLIPSADYANNAGARIRYSRLVESLADAGIQVRLVPIDAFDPLKATCDVAMVSKIYDARALVVAAALAQRGVSVGVDLFDDYFSQEEDSRLCRYRSWLRQMLRQSDIALCSTPVLADVIGRYRGDIPVHVLRDPAPKFDVGALTARLAGKLARVGAEGVLRVCWFGIGDNPYFPVGLSDLAAFRESLAALAKRMPVELTVLTNKRALDQSGLAMIEQLSLPVTVEEWSEQRESEILARSFLCFLPVNAQPFSVAKSLNRALTALTAGCQVLSVGFPLYAELDEWIYRDPESLLRDLEGERLRLSSSSLPALASKIGDIASPGREAGSLAKFLDDRRADLRSTEYPAGPIALLHGLGTTQAAHAAIKRAGGISIATPFCTTPLEVDAIVELGPAGRTALTVARNAFSRLKAEWRKQAAAQKTGRRNFARIMGGRGFERKESAISLPLQLSLYNYVMENSLSMVTEAFGPSVTLVSEDFPLFFERAI